MDNKKQRGYFTNVLAFDSETTGVAVNSLDPTTEPDGSGYYQMVSAGFIVADVATLTPIDELYVEIQWNGESLWSDQAASIHGLSKDYLKMHAFVEKDAVVQIGNFLINHFGPDNCIHLLGHNVATFDRYFLSHMFARYGIDLRFGNRHIDTYSLGVTLLGAYNSDELFEMTGYKSRGDHNALDDAKMALGAARRLQKMFTACLER